MSVAFCVTEFHAPEIVTVVVEDATGEVDMEKLALAEPAGMVTVASGNASAGWLLERLTTAPPAGAGPPCVTVPVPLHRRSCRKVELL